MRQNDRVTANDVERLYGLPLEDFTEERNALAGRLKREGDPERAAAVRTLAKPSVAAWAVNQLARGNEVQVRALLRAGERLREAQAGALAGEGGDALRAAAAEERDAIKRLLAGAKDLLPRASQTVLDRVAETLRAAAVDDGARDLLKRGVLTEDLSSGSGFDLLAGMPTQKPRLAARAEDEGASRERLLAEARQRVSVLRAEARRSAQEADAAERDARTQRDAADEAAAELARAEAELAGLR